MSEQVIPSQADPDPDDLHDYPEHARAALRRYRADLERRHRLLLALSQAAQVVLQARTPLRIYQAIGAELKRLNINVMALELSPDRASMVLTYHSLGTRATDAALKLAGLADAAVQVPLAPDGFFAPLIQRRESRYCESTADLAIRGLPWLGRTLLDRLMAMMGAERSIYAPVVLDGKVEGVLALVGSALTPDDLPAVSAFAAHASIALENARLLQTVQAGRELMRRTAQQAISIQEEERRRLSQAIHDSTAQRLTALHLRLEMLAEETPNELAPLRERLALALDATNEIASQLRSLVEHLRPPELDALGLGPTLQSLCRDWDKYSHLTVEFSGSVAAHLPGAVESTLYRFLREALASTALDGEAKQVRVELFEDREAVSVTVRDDGRQADLDARLAASNLPGGVGLSGIRERLEVLGGQLEIDRIGAGGTRVVARIPTRAEASDDRFAPRGHPQ